MRIQHNIAALNAYRNYTNNTNSVSKNLEKLSSGYRINRAGDDAAGLAISEKMRAQITGLEVAQKNAQDGVSLIQTAEGALQEVHSMLNRMVELADQSANGTYDNAVDRSNLQKEFKALTDEIDRIADATNFNGINLLNGDMDATYHGSFTAAAASTGAAGIDLNFTSEAFKGEGISVSVAVGATSGVSVNGNVITVTLSSEDVMNGVSADEILAEAKKMTSNAAATTDEDKAAWNEALSSLTVSGKGVFMDPAATQLTGLATATATSSAPTGEELTLQIGDTAKSYNQLKLSILDMHADSLGLDAVNVASASEAANAVGAIKTAINMVSSVRGDLGAAQNRLEHTMNNLSVTSENMTAAESRIRDVDVAKEMMSYTKNNILVQSAQAMLAQANQQPQGVLQLLQ